MNTRWLWAATCACVIAIRVPAATDLDSALQALRAVGFEGKGNAAASAAWKKLSAAEVAQLPVLLGAMDDANDLALNWLRSAVETVAARATSSGGALPVGELGQFLFDTRHHPRARRLAYELIARSDAASAEKLLPGMLNDPSLELRHDAVQKLLDQAEQSAATSQKTGAILLWRQALAYARDPDQIEKATKQLRGAGQSVDLVQLFGWLTQWHVIGPFDNTDRKGFDTVYPPERQVDLAAEVAGKSGPARWSTLTTTNEYGLVDLNQPYGKLKEALGYAYTEFFSDKAQPAELRLGSKNGWKIWFNGQFQFGRDEYHRGAEIDQYRLPVQLQPGKNTLLIKVCQNEQKEDWTVEWEFQLRITDALGTPIRPGTPASSRQASATTNDHSRNN